MSARVAVDEGTRLRHVCHAEVARPFLVAQTVLVATEQVRRAYALRRAHRHVVGARRVSRVRQALIGTREGARDRHVVVCALLC